MGNSFTTANIDRSKTYYMITNHNMNFWGLELKCGLKCGFII